MLSNFRPYCPLLVYLLLISYAELSLQQPLFNFFTSVAETASIQNVHHDFFMNDHHEHGEHIHMQEYTKQKVNFAHALVDQEKQQEDKKTLEVPQDDLKIKQDFVLKGSSGNLTRQQNLSPPSFYNSFIIQLPSPPPRV